MVGNTEPDRQIGPILTWAVLLLLGLSGCRVAPGATGQTAGDRTANRELTVGTGTAESVFGINGMSYLHYCLQPGHERMARARMERLVQSGAKWDRFDFWWHLAEPRPGEWDWSHHDFLVDLYAENGIEMLPILCYNAAWMESAPHCTNDFEAYAAFVHEAVRRYRDRVHCWEIWNEPNIPTFWKAPGSGGPSPPDYAELLRLAYLAAKRADPGCTVIAGATSMVDTVFLQDLARLGALEWMDAWSFHPYSLSAGPETMELGRAITNVRRMAAKWGRPDLPLQITEMGWHAPHPVDPQGMTRQADYLVQSYAVAKAHDVERLFWFCLQSWRENSNPRHWESWGLYSPEIQPKPSLDAYRTTAARLEGARFRGYAPLTDGRALVFERGADTVLVAWSLPHRQAVLSLPSRVTVTSATGRTQTAGPGNLALTPSPVFLELRGDWPEATDARAPEPDNALPNPGFEYLDPDHTAFAWLHGRFSGGQRKGDFDLVPDGRNGRAARLRNAEDAVMESFPLTAFPGERYVLEAYARPRAAAGESGVQLMFMAGTDWGYLGGPSASVDPAVNGWQHIKVEGTCPRNSGYLRIHLFSRDNPGEVLFDDLRLQRSGAEL